MLFASSDDEPLVKYVAPPKSQSKRKRVDNGDDADEGSENILVGRTKRSRLDETSPDSPDSGIEKAMNEGGQKEEEAGSNHTDEDSEEEEEKKSTVKTVTQQKKRGVMQSPRGKDNANKPEKKGKKIESEEEEDEEFKMEDSDEEEEKWKMASKGKKKKDCSASKQEIGAKPTNNSSSDSEGERGKSKNIKKKERKVTRKKKPVETDAVKEVERQVFGSSSESEEEKNESIQIKKRSNSESESTVESEDEKDKSEDAANLSSKEIENNGKKLKLQENHEEAEDSDSSSLPSLEDEEGQEKDKKEGKKKSMTKKTHREVGESATRGKDEENKAVSRLKRYIALCGVRRNYKKLFDGCRSVKAKVAVLKKELEELGVEGQPSIEKCKKARLMREEAQELAELDISNIITTQGRPKRRTAAAWPPPQNVSPPPSAYKRVVDSDSDSGDSHANKGCKRAAAWGNLQGIISDDGESD
ncbi:HIRA-interacting protein 3-like isoform X2 [Xyrauchen texanus]|uniref:HIRA-interacting protein 3-like isoform X2 n=1 Tax=Xyrauchen texanus TaxID=154827 RepID=UPI002242B5A4|nr:HIRA-interacting protein 3-like isoform X2 [Xyrauchen texanus]